MPNNDILERDDQVVQAFTDEQMQVILALLRSEHHCSKGNNDIYKALMGIEAELKEIRKELHDMNKISRSRR
jgi:hypothetical protein